MRPGDDLASVLSDSHCTLRVWSCLSRGSRRALFLRQWGLLIALESGVGACGHFPGSWFIRGELGGGNMNNPGWRAVLGGGCTAQPRVFLDFGSHRVALVAQHRFCAALELSWSKNRSSMQRLAFTRTSTPTSCAQVTRLHGPQ